MMRKVKFNGFRVKSLVLVLVLAFGAASFLQPKSAQAHCDSVNGPVVAAAKEALAHNDVRPALAYVQPEAEGELTAAFNQAMEVRKLGGASQQLADTYFFETTVRLHRVGEGAAYTGLKYETDFGPALRAADEALESGSPKEVNKLLEQALRDGLAAKFKAVEDARQEAAQLGTVASQRERAEAELLFEKYVLGLYEAATGDVAHGEGEQLAGHEAGHAAAPAAAQHAEATEANTCPYPSSY